MSRVSRRSQAEAEIGPVRAGGALIVLIIGGLLILWMLGAGASTRENCHNGDRTACAELRTDFTEPYR